MAVVGWGREKGRKGSCGDLGKIFKCGLGEIAVEGDLDGLAPCAETADVRVDGNTGFELTGGRCSSWGVGSASR